MPPSASDGGSTSSSAAAAKGTATPPSQAAAVTEAMTQAAAAVSLQQARLIELAFLKSDPRPVVGLMVRCFLRQACAPGARREGVVDMM